MKHSYRPTFLVITASALLLVAAIRSEAQFRAAPVKSIGDKITCHVGGSSYSLTPNKRLIYETSFGANYAEVQDIFERVTGYTELRSNIYTVPVLEEINVEICPGSVNYIAYNADWLKELDREAKNEWAIYAIIAHEIGHYVLAHDRTAVGSDPAIELQADEYAGEILAKMGACLSDAQAAFNSPIIQNQRGGTHPPIARRLAAVERGWQKFGKSCVPVQTDVGALDVTINIFGQLNTIYIRPASGVAPASSGQFEVRFQNETKFFYLDSGKGAEVNLFGQKNTVIISREIRNRVKISEPGQLNKVVIE